MSELNEHISIPKNVSTGDDLDYTFLRQKGQEYIEKLAGNIWTDYNEHDPGITILEMLSYAITDLGARISMPLENILTPSRSGSLNDQFFDAQQILPSKPVTEADYRKLFIDIDGVKNCWLKKYEKTVHVDCKNDLLSYDPKDFEALDKQEQKQFIINGLYKIIVDYDERVLKKADDEEAKIDDINQCIIKTYHANRNLCEDLVKVEKVEMHPIQVCASIELDPEVDEEKVHAQVLRAIDTYFSPKLWFYSLQQLFDKGYSSDHIFEGPVLSHGFIDPEELENARLRKEIRLSDIVQLIMKIDGVKLIKDISINDCNNPEEEKDVWLVCVDEGKKPVRCHLSAFSYYKGVLPVNVNSKKVKEYIAELEAEEADRQELSALDKAIPVPEGEYLGTGETTTIQNDFPETYGIGQVGLNSRASVTRKAQAKQLKAYLLFFDQIFATYFAHLDKVKEVLSVDNSLSSTYFTQAVKDIKGFSDLIEDYPKSNDEQLTKKLLADLDDNITRKNQLLDHLLARFAENFSQYSFLMKQLYGNYAGQAVVNAKQTFLSEYGEIVKVTDGGIEVKNKGISNWRGSAFNYFDQKPTQLWDTKNVAGAQKRIARLCGVQDFRRRDLSASFAEIYELQDADEKTVYRWRIRNDENEAVLSATVNYKTPGAAREEMYQSIVKVVETDPEVIKEGFTITINDEAEVGNFEIQKADSGKYSFDVINLNADPGSTDRIIARQFLYYDTQEELKQAILDLILFLRNDFKEEGMYIVEHILLRPDVTSEEGLKEQFMSVCTDNCESCEPIDPYSYRVTVILPGWTYRFGNMDFRNFMEDLIRRELPAHVLARVCWIGEPKGWVDDDKNDMVQFEKAYKDFLLSKTKSGQKQVEPKLKKLIDALEQLNSIYPEGRLIDCDDEEDSLKGRIILGRTNIGNL
ncbi:hypothetical protein [Draconibacterium sediminis]|uniref:Uncharacterized protein n=1 Tax=Draconibacterium sediminis TaxID=1544798 RepID=A0A0D8JD88_9BACT|nr:hypothetical protein [Draconibacterium sediminis]KJF43758.1 hypothetical protein LH29_11795 [Draconibacterium sediminis]